MSSFKVSATGRVRAPARRVYDLIADYRSGHTRIIPPQYFTGLDVEQGGVGAGTVIRVRMRMMGAERTYRAAVTEPEPGRTITETDLATGLATSFTVDPQGDSTDVTIATVVPDRPGLRGVIERWAVRRMLPQIYREELQLIAREAEK
jgi:hypothetical protein